jgi:hypothetical protein
MSKVHFLEMINRSTKRPKSFEATKTGNTQEIVEKGREPQHLKNGKDPTD